MKKDEMLVSSTEQEILQTAKWNKTLRKVLWILFVLLFLLEAILAASYCLGIKLHGTFSNQEYILLFFIRPCLIVLATILLTNFVCRLIAKRYNPRVQSKFILFALLIIVSEIIAFHYGVSVTFILYIIPITASILYVSKKMLLTIYLASIAMYFLVLTYVYIAIPSNEYWHNYMDILGTITILTAIYAICNMILSRIRELIDTAVEETILRVKLSHEVTLDPLTHLYNHAAFYERLDASIIAYRDDKSKAFALLLIDIDDFKQINDNFGHTTGDQVLLRLVDVINERIGSDELAFRYGGEEFAVLMHDPGRAVRLAEDIRDGYAKQIIVNVPRRVTVSIGVNTYSDIFGGKREFFSSVDEALYRAKRSGKNRVCEASLHH